jgi:hypothetical protein
MVAICSGIVQDVGPSATTLNSTMRVATLAGTVRSSPVRTCLSVWLGSDRPTRSMLVLARRTLQMLFFWTTGICGVGEPKEGQAFAIALGGFTGDTDSAFPDLVIELAPPSDAPGATDRGKYVE